MSNNSITATSATDQGEAPPLPRRRPRVREVSSRFMSPSPSSSSSSAGDLHSLTMKSPLSRPKHFPAPPLDNRSLKPSPSPNSQRRLLLVRTHELSHDNIPDTARSMDYSTKSDSFSISAHSKKQQRPVKLSHKENDLKSSIIKTGIKSSSRSDTPAPAFPNTCDRIVPSRFRFSSRHTDAAKLLQSSGLSFSSTASDNNVLSHNQTESESVSVKGGSCPNSPVSSIQHKNNDRKWPLPDTPRLSSITNEDDTLSTRTLLVRSSTTGSVNCQTSSKLSTPLCSRSLNLPLSGFQNSFKSKPPTTTSVLPPQPATTAKLGVDLKKGKKAPQCSQEDVHSLKLMHNHHLLWRHANAKAQASMHAQSTEMEKQFFSLGTDISNLRDTVKKKQVELAVLQRVKALSTILEAQTPYLEEWSTLEEDYISSLLGATNALTNSLLRLPVSGNVQVNIKEAAEALDSAVKTTDMLVNHMQRFLPKAEEMDTLMSELANVNDVEKALVEECGNLLSRTHTLQVEDCSLRSHQMQLRCSNVC